MQWREPLRHLIQNIHNVLIMHVKPVILWLSRRTTHAEATCRVVQDLTVAIWFAFR